MQLKYDILLRKTHLHKFLPPLRLTRLTAVDLGDHLTHLDPQLPQRQKELCWSRFFREFQWN